MGVMAEPAEVSGCVPARAAVAQAIDFTALVTSEQRRVFLLCQRMLQDREEADSAAQDVFFKAYKALRHPGESIEDPGKWLTRIAVNTCLDRLRSRRWQFWKKRPAPSDEDLILGMAATREPNAEARLFAKEIYVQLQLALGRLSDRQRAVFTLKHFEDRSLEEIGQILKLDVGTVKAHMARAVAKLRVELEEVYRVSQRRGSNE